MIGYGLNAVLKDDLTVQERNDVLAQVKKVKGVLKAAFTESAAKEIWVHSLGGPDDVEKAILKIPGVKAIRPDTFKKM